MALLLQASNSSTSPPKLGSPFSVTWLITCKGVNAFSIKVEDSSTSSVSCWWTRKGKKAPRLKEKMKKHKSEFSLGKKPKEAVLRTL
jgi:hypothetical protein